MSGRTTGLGPRSLLRRVTGADSGIGAAAVGTLGISLGGTAIRFVLQVLLANWMTQVGYGLFILARSWGELLAKLPARGYKLSAVRFLPRYETEGDWSRHRGFTRRAARETFALGVGIAAVAGALYALVADEVEAAYLVGFVLAPALAMVSLWRSLLQAVHHYVPALALTELAQPVVFAAAIGVAAAIADITPLTAVALWVGSMAAIALVEAIAFREWRPGPRHAEAADDHRDRWTRSARTDFVSQIAIAVLGVADVLAVGWTLGAADAALYAVATRIAVLGRIVNSGLESVVSPRITAAHRNGDVAGLQRLVDQTIRMSTWPTLAFGAGVALAATPILRVFGESYVDARTVLWILLAGNLTNALTGPSGFVTAMTGAERMYARVMGSHAVLLVVGAWAVAGPWGIVGVAVVRSLVSISWNVILAVDAHRRLGVRCYPRRATLFRSPTEA